MKRNLSGWALETELSLLNDDQIYRRLAVSQLFTAFTSNSSWIFNSRQQTDFHISFVMMLQNWLGTLFGCRRGKKKNVLAAVSGLWQPNVFFPLDFPGSDPRTAPLSLIFWGRSEAAPLNQLSPLFFVWFVGFIRLRISGITAPPFTSLYKLWDGDILALPAAADCRFLLAASLMKLPSSKRSKKSKHKLHLRWWQSSLRLKLMILLRFLVFGLYHCNISPIECVSFSSWQKKSECVCVMTRDADRCAYTESTALLTALDWSGLDWIRWDWDTRWRQRSREGVQVGPGGGGGVVGMQPSLRQHKQHADTVTGNTVIIILLFKVLLKTLKLYKKEENRIFALMKNTFFVFFFPRLQRRF